jgi:hypothetical protein
MGVSPKTKAILLQRDSYEELQTEHFLFVCGFTSRSNRMASTPCGFFSGLSQGGSPKPRTLDEMEQQI